MQINASASSVQHRANTKVRFVVWITLLSLLLIALMLISISTGEQYVSERVTPAFAFQSIARHLGILPPTPSLSEPLDKLVWELRLPRLIGGALVGALLAMAGVAFQSLLRNPLADPYMVGVSAGSALGAVVAMLLGIATYWNGMVQPLFAFGFGLLTAVVVYLLARLRGRVASQTFLLAGIVVGMFLWSMLQLALALAMRSRDPGRMADILSQQMGTVQAVGWREVALMLPFAIGGSILLGSAWRSLNLLSQGDETAAHLGVDLERLKAVVIFAGSLVTAASVSVAGMIAFVGMVVPHISRRLVGPDHRVLLPISMLLGAIVVVASDWMSRVYLQQLQVGVITSLLGAPVFFYLLRNPQHNHRRSPV